MFRSLHSSSFSSCATCPPFPFLLLFVSVSVYFFHLSLLRLFSPIFTSFFSSFASFFFLLVFLFIPLQISSLLVVSDGALGTAVERQLIGDGLKSTGWALLGRCGREGSGDGGS
jgi:predicted membrane metal-binding protein